MAKQKPSGTDKEFEALDQCVAALKALTQNEADRIISYLQQRFTKDRDFS